ncbi:MAG: hypothetical protein LIV22_05100 [Olegusella sp.]|jgi:hypothetical protein|nr:hypothetical protein [Olegusella sp.]
MRPRASWAPYGCGFKYTRCFVAMLIGGVVGGQVARTFGMAVYVVGASNILEVISFA